MARLSGLQREVLSLYRQCLREVRKKPIDSQPNFKNYARAEFQKHLSVNKKDFSAIEYLLRKGHRQLEIFLSEYHLGSSDSFRHEVLSELR